MAASPPPPTVQPAPAAQPQKQASPATPPQPAAQPPSQLAAPAYKPPEPDVSIKYQVLLGLPPDLSPLPPASAQARNKGDDNFDGPATEAADIASTLVAAFRRHLKTCSKLPASLSSTDDVKVKLRVLMTPEGRLAGEPILIEASASMKGPLLMQGAIRALAACQPYAMLPQDRYGEWKVLDLSFTPQDFSGVLGGGGVGVGRNDSTGRTLKDNRPKGRRALGWRQISRPNSLAGDEHDTHMAWCASCFRRGVADGLSANLARPTKR